MKANAVQIQLIPVSSSKRLVSFLVWSWVSLSFWFRLEHFIAFQFVSLSSFMSVSVTWTHGIFYKTRNIKTICLHLVVCLHCFYAPAYITQGPNVERRSVFLCQSAFAWPCLCLLLSSSGRGKNVKVKYFSNLSFPIIPFLCFQQTAWRQHFSSSSLSLVEI